MRVFPFFSKDFRGSAKRKALVFFGVSLFFFAKKSKGWRVRVDTDTIADAISADAISADAISADAISETPSACCWARGAGSKRTSEESL